MITDSALVVGVSSAPERDANVVRRPILHLSSAPAGSQGSVSDRPKRDWSDPRTVKASLFSTRRVIYPA